MFVLATRRSEFGRVWEKILSKRCEVRQVASLEDLRELLRAYPVQLVMLDLDLPDARNTSTLRALVQECGKGRLMLGGVEFSPTAELAGLSVGAVACCSPDLPIAECKKMVDVILGGGVWLSSAGIPALVERLRNLAGAQVGETPVPQTQAPAEPAQASAPAEDALIKLTRREREVAELVGSGANNKIIAKKLLITDRTVKAHLTAIYDKLGITDRLQLALRVSANNAAREAAKG